jgi:glutamate dehydrogenase (NAD(P)+)
MSQTELQRMTRRFTNGIAHVIGVYRDIPAPDMNTNAQTMAWMMDAFSATHGYSPGIVTGKPLDLGGQPGREQATGRGVIYTLEAYAKTNSMDMRDLRIAIQGFGNVGSWAALEAADRGARIVAVSDRFGGIHDPSGLDITSLVRLTKEGAKVTDLPGSVPISNEDLLVCDCDVLIPAALGEVIDTDNADRVQARAVIEAANYPVTPGGDKLLHDRGIDVVPDILANAGGVTGSYFEWTRNIQQMPWTEEKFNEVLASYMHRAYVAVDAFAAERSCTMRQAAFAIGIQRVAHASRMRGYI